MGQDFFVKARFAPSPRLRGEGWSEGESLRGRRQLDSRRLPLTRRFAPTSPRKRGEVKKTTEA